ncbi:MAG TPA: ankyrin repeat domain-containing protein [Candidatus Dependentiae bacterium]|nr:ankyrin repeat domain-containing protein [Candidatus Dependentiae bacterium]HRQ62514.1 ankyrin repeat domain-containing protein [Candidatus Dependentiae bacterium]
MVKKIFTIIMLLANVAYMNCMQKEQVEKAQEELREHIKDLPQDMQAEIATYKLKNLLNNYAEDISEKAPGFVYTEAFRGMVPAALLLIQAGANPNVQNKFGYTLLQLSIQYNAYETLKYLLKYRGINPNIQDNDGDTALHILTNKINYSLMAFGEFFQDENDLLDMLIAAGARKDIENNQGKTPYDIINDTLQLNIYDRIPQQQAQQNKQRVLELLKPDNQ